MKITLVTGGARSGKTRHALALAQAAAARKGCAVSYVATAAPPPPPPPPPPSDAPAGAAPDLAPDLTPDPAPDPEMTRRIARHRAERPASWETLEATGQAAAEAVRSASHPVVVVDCLTLLLTGAIFQGEGATTEAAVETRAADAVDALLAAAFRTDGELLVVTNEVGMGIVPSTPLGRWFRDAQGRANQRVAEAATTVIFMVSGLPLGVKGDVGAPPGSVATSRPVEAEGGP
jgi:adenosylcobinamide kinase/adenosylcobinamide-phosphate guanylyltransferase